MGSKCRLGQQHKEGWIHRQRERAMFGDGLFVCQSLANLKKRLVGWPKVRHRDPEGCTHAPGLLWCLSAFVRHRCIEPGCSAQAMWLRAHFKNEAFNQ
jgi:hypothetical protein